MPSISLTGNDTVKINDRVLADFADGDIANLTFPNDLVTPKRGKNGNVIYALNETGHQSDVTLRIIMGSSDDKFLNQLLSTQKNDLPAFNLIKADIIKRVGDGSGNITSVIYAISGGVFSKAAPEVKENVEGDVAQAVAVYNLKFANAVRTQS